MIFSCVVSFQSKKKKIPDLSLPPCMLRIPQPGRVLIPVDEQNVGLECSKKQGLKEKQDSGIFGAPGIEGKDVLLLFLSICV
jgi:hypothetical protein